LKISVIIHTINPRLDLLLRVVDALRAQTLAREHWELIVVDNGSDEPVGGRLDLSWHPRAQCLREEKRGAPWARLRGLRAAVPCTVAVFIDDDNLPAPDYLEQTAAIAVEWPMLGAWGGCVEGLYEEQPPDWLHDCEEHLAMRTCERPVWSAFVDFRSMPVGAGLCIRGAVAECYIDRSVSDPNFWRFGRQPGRGVSGDDQYLCFCSQDIGLGVGRFPQLRMRHIIPSGRIVPKNFLQIVRGNAHGAPLLRAIWDEPRGRGDKFYWPVVKMLAGMLCYRRMRRRVLMAESRGELAALVEARQIRNGAAKKAQHP